MTLTHYSCKSLKIMKAMHILRVCLLDCYAPAWSEGGNKRCFCLSVRLSARHVHSE